MFRSYILMFLVLFFSCQEKEVYWQSETVLFNNADYEESMGEVLPKSYNYDAISFVTQNEIRTVSFLIGSQWVNPHYIKVKQKEIVLNLSEESKTETTELCSAYVRFKNNKSCKLVFPIKNNKPIFRQDEKRKWLNQIVLKQKELKEFGLDSLHSKNVVLVYGIPFYVVDNLNYKVMGISYFGEFALVVKNKSGKNQIVEIDLPKNCYTNRMKNITENTTKKSIIGIGRNQKITIPDNTNTIYLNY